MSLAAQTSMIPPQFVLTLADDTPADPNDTPADPNDTPATPDTAYIPAQIFTEIFQILDRLEENMTDRGWGDEKSDADFARIAEIIETLQDRSNKNLP